MKKVIITILLFLALLNNAYVFAQRDGRGPKRDRDGAPTAQPQPTSPPSQSGPTSTPNTPAPRMIRESDSAVRDFLDDPTDNPMTPTPTPKGFVAPTKTPGTPQVQNSPRISGDELTVAFLVIVFIIYAIHKGWIEQLQKKYFPIKKRRR